MQFHVRTKDCVTYLEGIAGQPLIQQEHDTLDMIAICSEHGSQRLLLHRENLPDNFSDVKTGCAGHILQKFMNYQVKVAAVLPITVMRGRFEEMALETKRNQYFRVFHSREEAEAWLIQ